MQGDGRDLRSSFTALFQNSGCEMQSRCGSRHRSTLAREYGLVSFAIGGSIAALDVRGQRYMADAFELSEQIGRTMESHRAFTEFTTTDDLGLQIVREPNPLTYGQFASWPH